MRSCQTERISWTVDIGGDMLRIKGLVREFNRVRACLRDGIPADQGEAFREQVVAFVAQVEGLCRHHHTTPSRLPAPSRAAYRFLSDLDLAHLPLAVPGSAVPTESTLRLKNVRALEGHLADRMWDDLPTLLESADALQCLRSDIERHSNAVEAMCLGAGLNPGALAPSSRRVYSWMKFLCGENNLGLHLQGLKGAREALVGVHLESGPPIQLRLVHIQALWTKRATSQLIQMKISEGFISAGPRVWAAVIRAAVSRRNRADTQLTHESAQSEAFRKVLVEIDGFAEPPTGSARGRVYSLDEVFDRVNQVYFGGGMPRPRLEWNRMLTGRKFGHYHQNQDTVMLSVSLDDERVPSPTVDFVMYHELLHKKHGALMRGGRRFVHTAEFRAEERLFAHYADAQRQLDALAQSGGVLRHKERAFESGR